MLLRRHKYHRGRLTYSSDVTCSCAAASCVMAVCVVPAGGIDPGLGVRPRKIHAAMYGAPFSSNAVGSARDYRLRLHAITISTDIRSSSTSRS